MSILWAKWLNKEKTWTSDESSALKYHTRFGGRQLSNLLHWINHLESFYHHHHHHHPHNRHPHNRYPHDHNHHNQTHHHRQAQDRIRWWWRRRSKSGKITDRASTKCTLRTKRHDPGIECAPQKGTIRQKLKCTAQLIRRRRKIWPRKIPWASF